MTMQYREFRLATIGDPREILEHFNYFHDGLIKSFLLRTRDGFERSGAGVRQTVTGLFDAELELAHWNYGGGSNPIDHVVRAKFSSVKEVCLDLRAGSGKFTDWSIYRLEIDLVERGGRKWSLSWRRQVLAEGKWVERVEPLFQFESAVFSG